MKLDIRLGDRDIAVLGHISKVVYIFLRPIFDDESDSDDYLNVRIEGNG